MEAGLLCRSSLLVTVGEWGCGVAKEEGLSVCLGGGGATHGFLKRDGSPCIAATSSRCARISPRAAICSRRGGGAKVREQQMRTRIRLKQRNEEQANLLVERSGFSPSAAAAYPLEDRPALLEARAQRRRLLLALGEQLLHPRRRRRVRGLGLLLRVSAVGAGAVASHEDLAVLRPRRGAAARLVGAEVELRPQRPQRVARVLQDARPAKEEGTRGV